MEEPRNLLLFQGPYADNPDLNVCTTMSVRRAPKSSPTSPHLGRLAP